jgi:dystonin
VVLNDYRTSLPQRLSHLEPRKKSEVRQEVQEVTATYQELLAGANRLSDRVAGVGGRQREYSDSLDKAKAWLREAEPRANKCLSEPLSAEPRAVEEQLVRAKALHAEFLSQERLINTAVQVCQLFLAFLGTLLNNNTLYSHFQRISDFFFFLPCINSRIKLK